MTAIIVKWCLMINMRSKNHTIFYVNPLFGRTLCFCIKLKRKSILNIPIPRFATANGSHPLPLYACS